MGVDVLWRVWCSTIAGELGYYNKYHPDRRRWCAKSASQCKFQSRNVRIGEVDGFSSCPAVGAFWLTTPTEQQRALS